MLYIFDLDGTLRVTKSGRPVPNDLDDQVLLPNVREKLRSLYDAGHVLAAASNQGGVSHGYMTGFQCQQIQRRLNGMLGGVLAAIQLNFYHPGGVNREQYADRRKPKPDLLLELMRDYSGHDAVYVGNQYTDKQAAMAADIYFKWAHNFFGWSGWYTLETEKGFFPREWFAKWQKRKAAS